MTTAGAWMRCRTPSLARSKFDSATFSPAVPLAGALCDMSTRNSISSADAADPSLSRCGIGDGFVIDITEAGPLTIDRGSADRSRSSENVAARKFLHHAGNTDAGSIPFRRAIRRSVRVRAAASGRKSTERLQFGSAS
jgi:hypothetical protein